MKKLRHLLPHSLFVIFLVSQYSCVEDAAVANYNLGEIPLRIPIYAEEELRATNEYYSFHGETGSINLKNDIFEDIYEFKNHPIQLSVNNVKIKIVKNNNLSGSVIKNLTSHATNSLSGERIATYQKDGPVYLKDDGYSDADLTNYVKKIFTLLENDNAVEISVSGETDIKALEEKELKIGWIDILVDVTANIELK